MFAISQFGHELSPSGLKMYAVERQVTLTKQSFVAVGGRSGLTLCKRGLPKVIRTDNGPEIAGRVTQGWVTRNGMELRGRINN